MNVEIIVLNSQNLICLNGLKDSSLDCSLNVIVFVLIMSSRLVTLVKHIKSRKPLGLLSGCFFKSVEL